MKKIIGSLLVVVMSFLLVSCFDKNGEDSVTITDMVGDTVTIRKNPEKVAVISRAAADMMIGFGLGDKVDGMYKSILANSWTEKLYSKSAEFYEYGYNDSAELFISRDVDLVLAPEKYLADNLRSKGVNAITVSLYGTPTYEVVMYKIADLISEIWPETKTLVNEWKEELNKSLDDVASVLKDKEISERTIYYVRGDKNNGIGYTDTKGSLVETIYEKYFKLSYISKYYENAKPSIESILSDNPDVIVIGCKYQNDIYESIVNDDTLKHLKAVKENNVYNVPLGFVMWEQNSLALPLFVYDQANKLYQDYFKFDIVELTKTNFKKYYNVTLTNDEVEMMLNGQIY